MNGRFPYANPYSQQQQPQRRAAPNGTAAGLEEVLTKLVLQLPIGSADAVVVEGLLKELQQATQFERASSTATTNRGSPSSWTVSQVVRFAEWVAAWLQHQESGSGEKSKGKGGRVNNNNDDDSSSQQCATSILTVTAALMRNEWDDRLVYAACFAVGEDSERGGKSGSLLDRLAKTCATTGSAAAATSVLAAAWSSLERLQTMCRTVQDPFASFGQENDAWWIPTMDEDDVMQKVAATALRGISIRQEEWTAQTQQAASTSSISLVSLTDCKSTCATVLSQLLLYQPERLDSLQAVVSQQRPVRQEGLAQQLLQEAARLKDPSMPVSSYSAWSLACLQLLTVLQLRGASGPPFFLDASIEDSCRQFWHSSNIIEHLLRAATPRHLRDDDGNRGHPRWTGQQDAGTRRQSMAVLRTLYRASPVTISNALSRLGSTRDFLSGMWKALLQQTDTGQLLTSENLEAVAFLHSTCRGLVRDVLQTVVLEQRHGDNPFESVITVLWELVRTGSSFQAAALLKHLLADRRNVVSHDEISRQMWQAVSAGSFGQNAVDLTVSLTSSAPLMSNYNCPTLLCLLDLVYLLLSGDEGICQSIINTMSADTLESLVQIMSPKEVRVDLSMTGVDESLTQDDVIESDDSTPTVQNLSRLENSVVMVEEKREPHGMDQTARIAAATVLAVLGRHSFSGHDSEKAGRFSLLQGRMFDAANSFVSELNLTFSAGGGTALSTDMTKRRLRLLTALGTADNEEYLSGLLHTAETRRRRELTELSHHVHRCNEALEQYREKEKRLVSEKEAYSCRLAALSVSAQRDKSELQRSMAQNAKNLVATHLAERTKAEKRLQELSKQTAESERQLADAIRTAQSCRESEALAKSSLQQANARLNEVSSREQELAERTKHSESELGRVSDELRSLKASLNDILGKEKKMRGKMKEKEELLADMEESEIRMRESLENLFADMVSLARLYEIKEQEEAEARLKNDELVGKLKRQLEKERQRNAELEETQSRLQHDNEVLSNRYAKTREKLQREREKHQKEQEVQRRRNMGPVSYINQLHNQSMNAGSEKSRSEEANLRRRRKKPLVGGIENSQSSSASSPRRSRSRQRSRHHGM